MVRFPADMAAALQRIEAEGLIGMSSYIRYATRRALVADGHLIPAPKTNAAAHEVQRVVESPLLAEGEQQETGFCQ